MNYLIPVGEIDDVRAKALGEIYNDQCLTWLKKDLANAFTFLDCGCGNGEFTYFLAKRFPMIQFLGFDQSPEQIKIAQKRVLPNLKFQISSIQNSKEMADIVYARLVLIHQQDPINIAEHLLKLAKKKLIIHDINSSQIINGNEAISAWSSAVKLQHHLQQSHLNAIDLLSNYFKIKPKKEWVFIDTPTKKIFFLEGVKIAIDLLNKRKISDDLNPLKIHNLTEEEWLKRTEDIIQSETFLKREFFALEIDQNLN